MTPGPELIERARRQVAELRILSSHINAGHDSYIPNDADSAADLIEELIGDTRPALPEAVGRDGLDF